MPPYSRQDPSRWPRLCTYTSKLPAVSFMHDTYWLNSRGPTFTQQEAWGRQNTWICIVLLYCNYCLLAGTLIPFRSRLTSVPRDIEFLHLYLPIISSNWNYRWASPATADFVLVLPPIPISMECLFTGLLFGTFSCPHSSFCIVSIWTPFLVMTA